MRYNRSFMKPEKKATAFFLAKENQTRFSSGILAKIFHPLNAQSVQVISFIVRCLV